SRPRRYLDRIPVNIKRSAFVNGGNYIHNVIGKPVYGVRYALFTALVGYAPYNVVRGGNRGNRGCGRSNRVAVGIGYLLHLQPAATATTAAARRVVDNSNDLICRWRISKNCK